MTCDGAWAIFFYVRSTQRLKINICKRHDDYPRSVWVNQVPSSWDKASDDFLAKDPTWTLCLQWWPSCTHICFKDRNFAEDHLKNFQAKIAFNWFSVSEKIFFFQINIPIKLCPATTILHFRSTYKQTCCHCEVINEFGSNQVVASEINHFTHDHFAIQSNVTLSLVGFDIDSNLVKEVQHY